MQEAGVGEEEFRGQESEACPEGGQDWAIKMGNELLVGGGAGRLP